MMYPVSSNKPRFELMQRSPMRLSVTVPHRLYQMLQERSDLEGRSMSNLAAYMLEQGLSR